jgi:hypothetical protein
VQEALVKPPVEGKESKASLDKGWVVRDQWRGDHVLDAFVMGMWCLYMKMLKPVVENLPPGDAFEESRKALEYLRMTQEKRELQGFRDRDPSPTEDRDTFREVFGRDRGGYGGEGYRGYYPDES